MEIVCSYKKYIYSDQIIKCSQTLLAALQGNPLLQLEAKQIFQIFRSLILPPCQNKKKIKNGIQ